MKFILALVIMLGLMASTAQARCGLNGCNYRVGARAAQVVVNAPQKVISRAVSAVRRTRGVVRQGLRGVVKRSQNRQGRRQGRRARLFGC